MEIKVVAWKKPIDSNKHVFIVGSGAAGMMSALSCAQYVPVTILTDGKLGRSNSIMAQGGIQVPRDTVEDRSAMVKDMLKSARGLASKERIISFVDHIHETISYLLELGVKFDHDEDGVIIRRMAGGLSGPRIISTKDKIGPSVMKALRKRVISTKNIEVRQKCRVEDLKLIEKDGKIAYQISLQTLNDNYGNKIGNHRLEMITTTTIVCAAGGKTFAHANAIGKRTTNPYNTNQKIYELLEKIGIEERNKDLYQYQPFGIIMPARGRGRNIPETITNFSVEIQDRNGMKVCDTNQDRLEMVASMNKAFEEGRAFEFEEGEWGFKLVVPKEEKELILSVLPKLRSILANDFDGIFVQPVLHYYLGGFEVNCENESKIEGLFLAGEITTGLHGANRLMGTGLLESLVGGMIAGKRAAAHAIGRNS